jgi:hypothetical protein
MKLLTKEIETALNKLGDISQKSPSEIRVIFKLFNPAGAGTWYIYDRERREPDIFWCYANIGDPEMAECGTVSLTELSEFRGRFGLGIERDLHFPINKYTLQEVINALQTGKQL